MSDHTYRNFERDRRYLQGDSEVDRTRDDNSRHDFPGQHSYFSVDPRYSEPSSYESAAQYGYRFDSTSSRPKGVHHGKGPKNYKRADSRIEEEACEALLNDGDVDASNLEVSVKDGVVMLSGTVPTREQKRIAEDAVSYLPGVRDVENRLRVERYQ